MCYVIIMVIYTVWEQVGVCKVCNVCYYIITLMCYSHYSHLFFLVAYILALFLNE